MKCVKSGGCEVDVGGVDEDCSTVGRLAGGVDVEVGESISIVVGELLTIGTKRTLPIRETSTLRLDGM